MHKLLIFMLMFGTDSLHTEIIKSVELSYRTRGMQQFLHISRDSIEVKINDKISHYRTTKTQWQNILKTFQKVKLNNITKLKRPASKSSYDGALIAQLSVVTNLKEYNSISFDHDAPPADLIKIINAMKSTLVGTESKEVF